jgi:SAM-dependent methyltransferase
VAGLDDWLTVAQSADADDLRERILTGFKSGKPFTPYVPTVPWPARSEAVLDFGCGVGRNFPYLRSVATRVVGFDLPPMIARCRALAPDAADELVDDWSLLSTRRFDVIYASLVLQHVETAACRAYLRDFARVAPAVYLLSRSDTDFGQNMFELVAETGLYDAGECVEVDHDPDTHQLRILGRVPFERARRAASGGHYELLLQVNGREA